MRHSRTTPDRQAVLDLEPVPESAAVARRAVTGLLADAGRHDWAEAAQLAVSEVVTNAVLHARTALHLSATLSDVALRVEVRDHNPLLPAHGPVDDRSTTGRGMSLVAAVSAECGVTALAGEGKVVWFVVRDAVEDDGELSVDELLERWDLDEPAPDHASTPPPGAPTETDERDVVLRGLPPALWLAAREHHNAMLRDYYLHLAGDVPAQGPAVELALVDSARHLVFTAVMAALEEDGRGDPVGRARPVPNGSGPAPLPAPPARLDVRLSVPAGWQRAFSAMQDVLDDAERLAVAGRLLAYPALPEVLALRDWVCDQVIAQLAGVEASPWPGVEQERFTTQVHEREDSAGPAWDRSQVAGSDQLVVAADDANRIVAVSRPLADLLGWTAGDLVGRRVVTLVPPALREAHVAGFSRHLTTGEARLLGTTLRLPVLHADGSELPCDVVLEQAFADRGHAVYLAWMTPVG